MHEMEDRVQIDWRLDRWYKNRIVLLYFISKNEKYSDRKIQHVPGVLELEITNFFVPIPVSCTPPQDISRCICSICLGLLMMCNTP